MSLNLSKTLVDFLHKHAEQQFTARQIAEWIFETYPDECADKKKRSDSITNNEELIIQIAREIFSQTGKDRLAKQGIKTIEDRPRKFYFTEKSDEIEIEEVESSSDTSATSSASIKEHDLYPLLIDYLSSEHRLYSKRIDEKRSSNGRGPGGNKWLYPDVVSMEDLSQDWIREIKDCVKEYADKKTRLWSLEVKIRINRSNVREVFFQTVSNSSWANLGYLVAGEIEGADTLKELRMLASLHGIGLIRLDADNPPESQIIIPARERYEVDWDTANRLVSENKDFLDYIKLVRQFYQTGDIRSADWDMSEN